MFLCSFSIVYPLRCRNQLLKWLLNVLSNLLYGKLPHFYRARQFGYWLSHCCFLSSLCTVSLLLSSFFTNDQECHKYMLTWQGMPSCLLMCTPISIHSCLIASLLGWEKQTLSSFCKGRMSFCKSTISTLSTTQFINTCLSFFSLIVFKLFLFFSYS